MQNKMDKIFCRTSENGRNRYAGFCHYFVILAISCHVKVTGRG